jgi:hypothetical protein
MSESKDRSKQDPTVSPSVRSEKSKSKTKSPKKSEEAGTPVKQTVATSGTVITVLG